jgi:hypothetical protein
MSIMSRRVPTSDTSKDPPHPSRFVKKKNTTPPLPSVNDDVVLVQRAGQRKPHCLRHLSASKLTAADRVATGPGTV